MGVALMNAAMTKVVLCRGFKDPLKVSEGSREGRGLSRRIQEGGVARREGRKNGGDGAQLIPPHSDPPRPTTASRA